MPPARAKKARVSASTNATANVPTEFTAIAIHNDDDAHTPEQSEAVRPAGITQAQKQALIDNLQLESEPSHATLYYLY